MVNVVKKLIIENSNGTTSCSGIEMAFNPPKELDWHEQTRKWIIEVFTKRGCEKEL